MFSEYFAYMTGRVVEGDMMKTIQLVCRKKLKSLRGMEESWIVVTVCVEITIMHPGNHADM